VREDQRRDWRQTDRNGTDGRHLLTRRQALQLGVVAAGTVAFEVDRLAAAGAEVGRASGVPRERSFDEGWRFARGDVSGGEAPGFDDSSWRLLDLPHDWGIEDLPGPASTTAP